VGRLGKDNKDLLGVCNDSHHEAWFHARRNPDRRDHPGHPGRDRDPAVHERVGRTPARAASSSQLQTLRSQVELFKLEHRDTYPTADGTATGAWDWTLLTSKTDDNRDTTVDADCIRGPYLQSAQVNGLTGGSNMRIVADDATAIAVTNGDITGSLPTDKEGFGVQLRHRQDLGLR
jgi:hypothetical protein